MTDPQHHKHAAPRLFQTIAADGAMTEGDQLSRTRKLFILFITGLLLMAAPLGWASSAAGSSGSDNGPEAVLVKSSDDDLREQDGDNDDDDGDNDDNDDGTDPNTGATDKGKVTAGDDDDTGTGNGTRGQTGQAEDQKTGKETGAQNTDRPGLDTGVSTKGETDPGDHTGKTERR